ncbi:MAG: DUF4157 domain-containing protein [Myxococcota bacterium]|jgi:hypothetical protein|nr:DUF4157 domain-containing protein [Myxococcota bacterium]
MELQQRRQQTKPSAEAAAPAAHSASPEALPPSALGSSGSLVDELLAAAGGPAAAGRPRPKPLPHQAQLEASYGRSFGDVQAYYGDPALQAGLAALGAQAAARGDEVVFATASPSPQLVAHELGHLVQQSPASGPASSGVDLEQDAAQAAGRASVGQPAQVQGSAAPSLQKAPLTGDPREIAAQADAAGNTTVFGASHQPVSIDQAHGYQAQNAPVGGMSTAQSVQIRRDASNPLKARSRPPVLALYGQVPAEQGGTAITAIDGTVQAPRVTETADPQAIYINNQPTSDDVIQQGIGDCYFMSAVIAMASRDPGRVKNQVVPDGAGGANVTLFRWVKDADYDLFEMVKSALNVNIPNPYYHYEPVVVNASRSLIHWVDAAGADYGLRSAGFRVAPTPKEESSWWAAIQGSTLEVHREDTYDLALWVALLEKAFARFSEEHGQYGGASAGGQGGAGTTTSGYSNIDGGWSHQAFAVLYGRQAEGFDQDQTAYTPGANPLVTNWPALQKLMLLQGVGDQARPGDQTAPLITVTSMVFQVAQRLVAQIAHVRGDAALRDELDAATWTDLDDLDAKTQTYVSTQLEADMTAMGEAAKKVAALDASKHAALFDATKPRPIRALMELVTTLTNAGTDNSTGQRWIYGNHVYGVLSTDFVSVFGTPVSLSAVAPLIPPEQMPMFLAMIDPAASTIKLRNPHHGNEPNPENNGPADRKDDGVFTLSMEQFFTVFTSVEGGVVPRTGA